MPKTQTKYICQQCGYESTGWLGKCPNCGSWNSLVETITLAGKDKDKGNRRETRATPVRLGEVEKKQFARMPIGIPELDRALGGGLVAGQVVLVAGEPGIGKSTLLLQAAAKVGSGTKVLYVSGEESAQQIAMRAERLGVSEIDKDKERDKDVYLLAETDIDEVLSNLSNLSDLGMVVIDSIQTMVTEDLDGVAGSVGQVRECAGRVAQMAKRSGIPVFLVGHVTKEGAIAGPRVLEHLVDTVLWFEGSRSEGLRVVRAIKNRFGPTDEAGVFEMRENGLIAVENPSALFLKERGVNVSGSVVTCALEGTRPLLVEVQALVVPSQLAVPRRVASGVDFARLQLLVAVLTRRLGLPLGANDVFVNIAGGLRVEEPAADLAIVLAIASAYQDKPVDSKTVVLGEVGLLGEVRPIGQMEKRIKEAKRLGFTKTIGPGVVKTVEEAVREIGRGRS